ncbi:type II toxin-antitoxin system VapC family toxin [Thiohalocapsa sp. ML1]|jgi:predicted nucleic acid-binding protein|uniref:type II toxin-antitoxin system VapC family toxin n=1 Tax=Thiohalocapsa sp. ML1 TaxID=1431688 RepID=UPI0007323D32|nr:type II toxin-antitoxin system VapC family toxin [Thiohalocapsa sp. ML1]
MACLLDTNVLIYWMSDALASPVAARIEAAIRADASYSVVTRMEILGWRGHTNDSRTRAADLLEQLQEVALTRAVVDQVIDIRSSIGIKLPDAIVAASALTSGLPLMTRNLDDFKRIAGLQIVSPFQTA